MNKFVLGALALTASTAPSLAGTGTEEWTKLDKDIESLASSLAPQTTGAAVSGFIKTSFAGSGDVLVPFDTDGNGVIGVGEGNDLGGFSLDTVRVNVDGTVGSFGVHISMDGAAEASILPSHLTGLTGFAGNVNVLDAYATFQMTNEISGWVGDFRAPFLGESWHNEDQLLFMDRTGLGNFYAQRDLGLMFSGQFGAVGAQLAAMNGADGPGDELMFVGRVNFTVMGVAPTVEGAYGSTGQSNLTIGGGYLDDGAITDATAFCVDASFNIGAFSAMAAMVDQDVGIGFALPGDTLLTPSTTNDATPWMAQVGFMVMPNQLELGVRMEDFDDQQSTTALTVGGNWYVSGHAAKVQLNWSSIDSDIAANEIDMYQVGVTASI